ncbi:LLM class flavin-dependent oxidoreductase [Pseudonocardia sp. TRM90224]|uniref:LLM class flavin-dependent oxidoreductase n=1 Tax=Pseudonocardia sp. TRM90224 TaxID=2812678 RepID=UPI001E39E4C2|nr:LLM class flavin-dependent oxidoreductase [Pseudonocardia sp. TRM90224]
MTPPGPSEGEGLAMTGDSAREIRPLRFGALAPITIDVPTWRDQVCGLADSGYSTILMPDVPQWQPAPGPALAVAATITGVRVGTWVYASPVRPAWITAWEAHSLSVLTEGRFEMGIGTGRPGIADQLRELGLAVTPTSQRSSQVREIVAALRDLDGPDLHTPVVMAVGGPKAGALAAELADTVTFVMPQIETRSASMQRVQRFDNRRDVELALHVPVVGDSVAAFMAGPDTDPAAVRAADSLAFLSSDPSAAAEEIQRRREEIGFSYFVFGADVAGALAPVVAELAGR